MSSTLLINSLKKIPFPIFGTASTAITFTSRKATILPKLAPWALPAGAGALWFVWPAVDEEWKQSLGFSSSAPAPAPAPAPAKEEKVELSQEALAKVEKAYVVETKELTEDEKAVVKAVANGDYTLLEKEWDSFQEKASVPGDGDDDEDEDDDDEDEEDEEEEDDE